MADATATSHRHVTTTDEEVTVSDRSNRAATPLIEGRTCRRRVGGAPQTGYDATDATRSSEALKEWISMLNDTAPERPPTPAGEEHTPQRADEPRHDTAARRGVPSNAASDSDADNANEMDIVDFQSMQSFPASDAPAWPSTPSEPGEDQTNEQDRG
jgi:hypothetical protein